MMNRSMIGISAMVCLLLLSGCSKTAQVDKTPATQAQQSAATADTVQMTLSQQTQAGVRLATVETRMLPRTLTVTGKVAMDESRTAHIGALADGIVERVKILPGDHVRAGQTLAELHSHIIHETAAAVAQAFAEVEQKQSAMRFAQQSRQRYAHLYSIQAASLEEDQKSDQQLVQAQKDLRVATANLMQEREHMSELVQTKAENIHEGNVFTFEDVPVRTPISGVVVTRNITPATVVQAGTEAFLVTDLSTVWVTGAVNERDVALLKMGSPVSVKVQGYGEEVFRGSVGQIGATLDPVTRTIPVRVVVPNADGRLKPEMFATVAIEGEGTRPSTFVPEEAVQEIKGVPTVFVRAGAESFRAQVISPGVRTQGKVEVLQGLKPQDAVVTSGAFMVKSSLLKGSMEAK